MKRLADWEKRFERFLEVRGNQGVIVGERDCLMLVYDAVIAMTGVDLNETAVKLNGNGTTIKANIRGKYSTMEGGYTLARYYAFSIKDKSKWLYNFFSHIAGINLLPQKPLDSMGHGDIVMFNGPSLIGGDHDTMGMVVEETVHHEYYLMIVAQGKDGLTYLPKEKALKVWGFVR